MKRLILIVIMAMIAGQTSWAMSQEYKCFPGRFPWFGQVQRVPKPLTPHRPIVPAFHYPPGVGPTMADVPLATRNPSLDVDLSLRMNDTRTFPLSTPTQISPLSPSRQPQLAPPIPQCFPPIPMFFQNMQVADGKFESLARKQKGSVLVPVTIVQEEQEGTTLPDPPAIEVPVPIVVPVPSVTPVETTPVDSDPFDSILDEEEETPVVVETPDAPADEADDSDPFPFDSVFDDEEETPAVVETLDAPADDADDSDPFGDVFDEEEDEESVVVDTPDAPADDADDSNPFGDVFDDVEDDATVVAPTPDTTEDDADDSNPFGDDFDEDEEEEDTFL